VFLDGKSTEVLSEGLYVILLLKFIEIVSKLMAPLQASERRGVEFRKSTKIFEHKDRSIDEYIYNLWIKFKSR
jgi:hypothetical protein